MNNRVSYGEHAQPIRPLWCQLCLNKWLASDRLWFDAVRETCTVCVRTGREPIPLTEFGE
jgi:hypothetical protein